jgi:hypothetical protein
MYWSRLTNTMAAIHRLHVHMRVLHDRSNKSCKLLMKNLLDVINTNTHCHRKKNLQGQPRRVKCHTQSLSYKMTVSADTRLMPSPPARVLNRKTNLDLSSLNSLICIQARIRTSQHNFLHENESLN